VPNTPWFALAVRRRRIDLRLSTHEIPARGGPSVPTMYKIESGTGTLTPVVLTRLDTALAWEPGSAARALTPDIHTLHDVLDIVGDVDPPLPSAVAEPLRRQLTTPTPIPIPAASGAVQSTRTGEEHTVEGQEVGRRQQMRAYRTRTLLIAAGAYEITRRGYTAASTNTILTLAGVSKGAMYFHFHSKADLADAVLTDAEHRYTTLADRWRTAAVHPAEAIRGLAGDLADAYNHWSVLQADTVLAFEPRFKARRPSRIWEHTLTDLAHAVADIGALRADLEPDQLARALIAAVTGHCHARNLIPTLPTPTTNSGAVDTDVDDGDERGGPVSRTQLSESVDTILTAMTTPSPPRT
jgi:AcrR family transcriptional regulator